MKEEFRTKSLSDQLAELYLARREFGAVCLQQYRRFLLNNRIAKYRKIEKLPIKDKSDEYEVYACTVVRILVELMLAEQTIVYFDTSTVIDCSFRQHAWVLKDEENQIKSGWQARPIKIYAAISIFGVEGLWFHQELNSDLVSAFLKSVASRLNSRQRRQPTVFFLDNAIIHKTEKVRRVVTDTNSILLYNAKAFPKLNLCEHFFEHLKRPLRKYFNLCPYKSISKMLFQAKNFGAEQIAECVRRQHLGLMEAVSDYC